LIIPCFAQNNKALQISEYKIPDYYYTVNEFLDNQNNYYFINHDFDNQNFKSIVTFRKFSSSGELIKILKLTSLHGTMHVNGGFQKIDSNRFLITLNFYDSIQVQNQVYKVRYSQNNQLGVNGGLVLVFNKNLEILQHKLIGFGVNTHITSISHINQSTYLMGIKFTDTLDTRPCGGELFVVAETDTIIGEHTNSAFVELDLDFNVTKIIHSNSLGQVFPTPGSPDVLSKKISAFTYAESDTLRIQNLKWPPVLVYTPMLFKLGGDSIFQWYLQGKPAIINNSATNGRGRIRSIIEGKDKNFIALISTVGQFSLGDSVIGAPNKNATAILKFDSLGNILWTKTITTIFPTVDQSTLYLNPQRDRFLFMTALQDTFSLGGYHFSIPIGNYRKCFIAEFDLDGVVHNFKILGYDQEFNGINHVNAQLDSVGNTYAIFTTKGTGAFTLDCFSLPDLESLEEDSSRLVWLKYGPSTLIKDTIIAHYDACSGTGSLDIRYKTEYPTLHYYWNGQPVESVFTFAQSGTHQLIVKDATCYADTFTYYFPPPKSVPQPLAIGSEAVAGAGAFIYHIAVVDTVLIHWQVTGGTILSGQGTDSISVSWQAGNSGQVIVTVSDSSGICSKSDTLTVLITSLALKQSSEQWHIRPNPAKTQIAVTGSQTKQPVQWQLQNLQGKTFLKGNENNAEFQINVQHLPAGIYFLKLKNESGTAVWKVVKE
jgi:hypothetical protein